MQEPIGTTDIRTEPAIIHGHADGFAAAREPSSDGVSNETG